MSRVQKRCAETIPANILKCMSLKSSDLWGRGRWNSHSSYDGYAHYSILELITGIIRNIIPFSAELLRAYQKQLIIVTAKVFQPNSHGFWKPCKVQKYCFYNFQDWKVLKKCVSLLEVPERSGNLKNPQHL